MTKMREIGSGTRRRVVCLAMLALLATGGLAGCGSKAGYPTAKPVSVLNQPGECAYCHRKIERVTEDNLVTYDGVQYIVCDEKCAAAQKIAAER
jgi:hypothetical protein